MQDAAIDPDIDATLGRLVTLPRVAPSAAAALLVRAGGSWVGASGSSGSIGKDVAAGPETIFDLASVTKPFVAVTFARLAQRGVLEFETELGEVLPELSGTSSARATMELLLSHRAGLDAHRKLFAPLVEGRAFSKAEALLTAASARRPECEGEPPSRGFAPVYSDLGYLLIGAALAAATGTELDALVRAELSVPFGIEVDSARGYRMRDPELVSRVAPTETMTFRGGEIRGAVHDENAWAFSGHGLAGQAGLFGTARAVARFGALVLDALGGRDERLLATATAARLVRSRAAEGDPPTAGSSLRAGFDGKSGPGSAAGQRASEATFGHLGFTGTSLWCDPRAEIVTVLLTNRVCPSRDHTAIRLARPQVHDALYSLAEARAGNPR